MDDHQFAQFSEHLLTQFLDCSEVSICPSRLQEQMNAGRDTFAIAFLGGLLEPYGEVEQVDVPEEWRVIKVWSKRPSTKASTQSKLLNRMAKSDCLIYPCSEVPTADTIRGCMSDLFLLFEDLQHKAKLERKSLVEEDLPWLWILVPVITLELLEGFQAERDSDWPRGIYSLPIAFRTSIVALNELPSTPETSALRQLRQEPTE
jgi:hypothetical protein